LTARSHEWLRPDISWPLCPDEGDEDIFAIELGCALIADTHRRTARIQVLVQHQLPGVLQPQLLQILQGTHAGHRPKVLSEGRGAHVGFARQIIHGDILPVVLLQPCDDFGNLLAR